MKYCHNFTTRNVAIAMHCNSKAARRHISWAVLAKFVLRMCRYCHFRASGTHCDTAVGFGDPISYMVRYFNDWRAFTPVFWPYFHCTCAKTAIFELPVKVFFTSLITGSKLDWADSLKDSNNLASRRCFYCTYQKCRTFLFPVYLA